MTDLVGKHFGQYELTGLIGEGGMGQVYRARDAKFDREVAIKVLPLALAQNHELVQRFLREANAAAALDHPNIIDVYTMGVQDGLYYMVMRLIEGEPLSDMSQQQRLPPERVLRIVEQVADALAYAHQKGIIHRDIKPGNVMVGPNDRITLMDFGIAKAPASQKLTRVGQVMGTMEYMSPEQAAGAEVDARTDLYALGIVLYELLTGGVPFSANDLLTQPNVYDAPPPPRRYNPQIPAAVESVILRALARRPEQRYATAADFITALRAAFAQYGAGPGAPALKIVFANGVERALQPGVVRIGRMPDNTLVLDDERVSRYHAEIQTTPQQCVLVDLGSANGTFVNQHRLPPNTLCPLQVGMQVYLGVNTTFTVQAGPVTHPDGLPAAGSLNTTKDADAAAARPPRAARPTTILAAAAARLTPGQLALAFGGLILLAVAGVWLGAPLLRQIGFVWYNLPLVALVGPAVYAALRRRWVTLAAHTPVAFLGGVVLWQQVDYYSGTKYGALLIGAVLSGLFMEGWLRLLPKVTAGRGEANWRQEVLWLAVMAMLSVAILYGSVALSELTFFWRWPGAALLGAVGWFLGDSIHQYLTLRRQIA